MLSAMERLRGRKLVQWALAYLAGAWVLLEAFGFIADRFAWPPMLVRGAAIVLAIGFLVVLVLAWYHGEKGQQRASRTELMLLGTLLLAAAGLLRAFAPADRASSAAADPSATTATTRFLVLLPQDATLKGTEPALAISRDGSKLAFAAGKGDTTRLYVRELGRLELRPVPGTEGARAPFFSPDGEWLGFFADHAVKKVSLRGGAPQTLVDGAWTSRWEAILSGRWGAGDVLLLSYPLDRLGSSIWQVPATGGVPRLVGEHGWQENRYLPQLLPDGEHALVSSWNVDGSTKVFTLSLSTGEQRVLVEPAANGHYDGAGHLLYTLGKDLYAVDFDADRLEVTGTAVPVVENVLTGEYETAQFALSATGTLAYVPGGVDRIERTLVWVDKKGAVEPVQGSRIDAYTPRISPSGTRIAFQRRPAQDLWLLDLERGSPRPAAVIDPKTPVFWHTWTPDGNGLVFNADPYGTGWLNLYEARLGPTPSLRRLTNARAHQQPQGWSSDGKILVYTQGPDPATQVDIWTASLSRDRTLDPPRPFLRTPASEFHPALSPDGDWMAYVSDVAGRWEVYVAPYPGPGPSVQISSGGGSEPLWSPDGRTLYYRDLAARNIARRMMAVAVRAPIHEGEDFRADTASVLFDGPYYQCSEWGRSYDLSPDGRRFLMVYDQRPDLAATQINVVVNWFAELSSL